MNISPNQLISSLACRTREQLRADAIFIKEFSTYPLADKLCTDGQFDLHHYLMTSGDMEWQLNKCNESALYPALFTLQPIYMRKAGKEQTAWYDLAFMIPIDPAWSPAEIDSEAFGKVLRPLYNEFMQQVKKSGYFVPDCGMPPHDYYEILIDQDSNQELLQIFNDRLARIEIKKLELKIKNSLSDPVIQGIKQESNRVTEDIKNVETKDEMEFRELKELFNEKTTNYPIINH